MGGRGKGRGGARKQAGDTSRPISSRGKHPSSLPTRYNFTPAMGTPSPPPDNPTQPPSTHVKDYPPPRSLLDGSQRTPGQMGSPQSQPHPSASPRPSTSPRRSASRRPSANNQELCSPRSEGPVASDARTNPSSQAQNDHSDGEEASNDEDALCTASLSDDQLRILNALLRKPGREEYTTVLSPTEKPGTTWFGRDKSSLTRKITKIFTNKFDGPYYSWTCVPRDRQERYFVEFAKTHTWDPLVTGLVQEKFEKICQKRMKDMVSTARTSREKPKWITDTLWTKMCAYWDTEPAQEKSETTSHARMSDRGGLGPHVHFSGQKSYLQIQQEMEIELGRKVSLGEVFIRIHTRPDGSFVDQKARTVAETYQRNKDAKLSNLGTQSSLTSDGTSPPLHLTIEQENELFLQSTFVNERGVPYGVGSLSESQLTGKRKYPGSSESYSSLQEQLQEAQRQIEAQAAENARREAELIKVSTQQQAKIDHLSLLERYLKETDPRFQDFMATHSTPSNNPDQTTTPSQQINSREENTSPTAEP